jgi:hypothetical protein
MSSLYLHTAGHHFVHSDRISLKDTFSINIKLVDIVASACACIWNKNAGKPGIFIIEYVQEIKNSENALAAYLEEMDRIYLALPVIAERSRLDKYNLFLLSAHEAFHKYQSFRGDEIPFLEEGRHDECHPMEIEAWIQASDALKGCYPRVTGRIVIDELTQIEIPKLSTYAGITS